MHACRLWPGDILLSEPTSWRRQGGILDEQDPGGPKKVVGIVEGNAAMDLVDVATNGGTWLSVLANELVIVERLPVPPTPGQWAAAVAGAVGLARRTGP